MKILLPDIGSGKFARYSGKVSALSRAVRASCPRGLKSAIVKNLPETFPEYLLFLEVSRARSILSRGHY